MPPGLGAACQGTGAGRIGPKRVQVPPRWLWALSRSVQYLVAARVTLLSFPPQRGAHPKPTQPQADGTAGARPALDIPLTGLQGETKRPFVPVSATQEKPEGRGTSETRTEASHPRAAPLCSCSSHDRTLRAQRGIRTASEDPSERLGGHPVGSQCSSSDQARGQETQLLQCQPMLQGCW